MNDAIHDVLSVGMRVCSAKGYRRAASRRDVGWSSTGFAHLLKMIQNPTKNPAILPKIPAQASYLLGRGRPPGSALAADGFGHGQRRNPYAPKLRAFCYGAEARWMGSVSIVVKPGSTKRMFANAIILMANRWYYVMAGSPVGGRQPLRRTPVCASWTVSGRLSRPGRPARTRAARNEMKFGPKSITTTEEGALPRRAYKVNIMFMVEWRTELAVFTHPERHDHGRSGQQNQPGATRSSPLSVRGSRGEEKAKENENRKKGTTMPKMKIHRHREATRYRFRQSRSNEYDEELKRKRTCHETEVAVG